MLAESSYTRSATLAGKPLTGLVDPRKALELFDDGATVVFQGLHRYWPPITRLVAELELELGHPCQANAYLTPPGSQGFAVHSDSHDVFVFQTAGAKQWEMHTTDGVEDVALEPGLCVYLPTGTPHAARAQDTVSLHVTLGINQLTWRGLTRAERRGAARRGARQPPARRLPRRARRPGRRPRRRLATSPIGCAGSTRAPPSTTRSPVPHRPQPSPPRRPARPVRPPRPRRRHPAARRPGIPACCSTAAAGSGCCSATAPSTYPRGWAGPRGDPGRPRSPRRPRRAPRPPEPARALPPAGPRGPARGRE